MFNKRIDDSRSSRNSGCSNVLILLQRHHSPAFRVPTGRDVAPIHFAAGMEETAFGRRCIEQMLIDAEEAVTGTPPGQRLAEVIDVRTLDGETALQVTTMELYESAGDIVGIHSRTENNVIQFRRKTR